MAQRTYFIFILLFLSGVSYAQDIQWAAKVLRVSSEFNYEKYPTQYRADQVLGTPSVEHDL